MKNHSTLAQEDALNSVTPETVPALIWQHTNVITTELLAKLYGAAPHNVVKNYRGNASRFQNGKHLFKVTGVDLQSLRVTLGDSQISPKARSLILWTERGAARHAKMLETEQAWEVFEKLEDCYFRKVEASEAPLSDPSTVKDRLALYTGVAEMVVLHHLSFSKAYRAVNDYAGVLSFKAMSKGAATEASGFVRRYVSGEATQRDFARIDKNHAALTGECRQAPLISL